LEAFGGAGDDFIYTIAGYSNTLSGGLGADTIEGSYSNTYEGGRGPDVISGGAFSDEVYGNLGVDQVYGNGADDTVFGGQADDSVFGGNGDTTVYGNDGADLVYGNKGDDVVYGNAGDDTLYGGTSPAFDVIDADSFVIEDLTGPSGNDEIADFEVGSDTIRIAQNVNGSGIQSFADLSITQGADGNAVIALGDDNSLTIQGIAPGELSASDFSFF
jgi:Ca2+-binding RTX toxin-like protein